jgi:hypothetical protein
MTMKNRITQARRMAIPLLGLGLFLALSGCNGITQPEMGTIRFESGPGLSQCSPGVILLFIDASQVGTMLAGSGASFPVSAGTHVVSARGSRVVWDPESLAVSANGTSVLRLLC